jgi:hypothetical protein
VDTVEFTVLSTVVLVDELSDEDFDFTFLKIFPGALKTELTPWFAALYMVLLV